MTLMVFLDLNTATEGPESLVQKKYLLEDACTRLRCVCYYS